MLLLLGPVITSHPSSIGGTTQSFSLLTRDLHARGITLRVIATNRLRMPIAVLARLDPFLNAVWVLISCLLWVPRAKLVMLNANPRGATVLGPWVYRYCRLWRRPFVFRMFGGDLIEVYEGLGEKSRRRFAQTVLQADLVLLQTQRLLGYFKVLAPRLQWLPTSREPHTPRRPKQPYQRRIVFLSSVRQSKGVDWVLRFRDAHRQMFTVHLYGPIAEERYAGLRSDPDYRGVVAPDQVAKTLAEYDVLVLPTEHPGEGYPGVVIEANSAGLPVVATRWMSLPELIHDDVTGRLTPTSDYAAFEAALLAIDDVTYARWSESALLQSKQYQTPEVNDRLVAQLSALAPIGAAHACRTNPESAGSAHESAP